MSGFFYKALLVGTAAFVLTACDSSNGGGSGGGNGGDDSAKKVEENFGAGFAAAFNANANSEPIDPTSTDIIAVDPTADPIDF